jgi:integrase
VTLHALRHTHATLLLAAGVPLHVVSRRLGHASEAFTAQVYPHVLPQQGEQAAATFAALVAGAS